MQTDPMSGLLGRQLSAVVFVRDYVQLQFDGPTLTAVTLPVVNTAIKTRLTSTLPGYRDGLCDAIGKEVRRATVDEAEVRLEFEDSTTFTISLRDDERRAADAVIFDVPGQSQGWSW
jgi:hypothetical protein